MEWEIAFNMAGPEAMEDGAMMDMDSAPMEKDASAGTSVLIFFQLIERAALWARLTD